MGPDGCNCKQSSHCKKPAAGLIITRKDFIITPVTGPRKSCGCIKKGLQPDLKIESVNYEIFKSFVPDREEALLSDDEDNIQQRCVSSTTPLTAEKWLNGPDADKETRALDLYHPLRMPNLVLDDGVYASEINSIAPDARFIYEPHVHSTQHGVQQHFHGGTPQDIYGISHFGVSQVGNISDSKRHHKHFTGAQQAVPQMEQLIDTLKRFDYKPPNMPNLAITPKSNMPNTPNMSNIPNMSKRPNLSNIPNNLNMPNMSNMPHNSNMPNISNMSNMPNNSKMPDMSTRPNMPNMPNNYNMSNRPNISNMPNKSNMLNMPNMPNIPNNSNIPNMANMPNNSNISNMSNMPNMPNMPNSSIMPYPSKMLSEMGYINQNLNTYDSPTIHTPDPALREEIRNLVRSTEGEKKENRIWLVLVGLVHLLQALLTTAAVLVYYLVWCYTQMMYFIMKSMLFFHNAEGSMKFAIGLVTVTSVIFAYSLVVKVERIFFRF